MSNENHSKEKQVGDYLLNEEIGSGGFAKVVLGTHIPTGEKVAVKIMDKEQILSDELNKERVLSEIAILKIVRHNNIIKLYEVMETPQKIFLVMEYCDGGELFDYIVSKQHLSEKQACLFFQELIDALTYLHSQNIVHRDVKPENILLENFGKSMTCKLIDFGISRTYTLDKLISTPCGTASYAPPEMHRGEEYYGLLSDVWSAGVLLYAMVFGYLPFCEEDEDTNIDNIIKGNYEIPEEASPQLADFLKHILDIDPLTRYDLDQIKKHPWYNIVTPVKSLPGIIIGYHKIPIDDRILNVCEAYGFDKESVRISVAENKYDNKSAIYYIILSKMKREGYDSISDLFSEDYLEYIKNPDNIIKKEEKEEDKKEEEKDEDKKEEEKVEDKKEEEKVEEKTEEKVEEKKEEIVEDKKEEKVEDKKEEKVEDKKEEKVEEKTEEKVEDKKEDKEELTTLNEIINKEKEENKEEKVKDVNDNNKEDSDNFSAGGGNKKSRSSSNSKSPKKEEEENKEEEKKEIIENEIKEENKPLETLSQIIKEKNIDEAEKEKEINESEKKEEENKKQEEIPEKKEEEKKEIVNNDNKEEKKEEEKKITVEEIIKEENKIEEIPKIENEPEKVPSIPNEIEKGIENNESTQVEKEEEKKENKETLPKLEEKINNESEKKEEKEEIIEKEKKKESENKNEISKENLDKKGKKVEIEVSKRPRDLLGFSLVPKHSFLINLDRNNSIFINEDGERNKDKLNTSFTMKLSDDLKENVLKMRNPKMKNPNKEKEINKALQEIKQQKGTSSAQSKKVESNKGKNKKTVKISNEPLFKENKRKDHTIIHNRNASAMGVEKRGNNEENGRQKRKASVNKINTKNLKNPGGIDLKNNIKRIKKEKDNKEKDNKEKDNKDRDKSKEKNIKNKNNKDIENSYSAKKRNISMFDINSNEKSKKSSVNIRKNNIPKPMTSRKNEKNSSMVILTTTSNTKPHHIRKNVSVTKKINNNYSNKNILKTPCKNIEKKNLETIYKNVNTTNIHIKKKENPSGILNKTIQLSDVKKNSKRSKIPFDKNSNKKKNIRIAFKNIEEEDIDIDKNKEEKDIDTNKEDKDKDKAKTYTEIYNKNKSSKANATSNIKTNNNISTTINNSVSANNINLNGGKKKKINHNKSHSIREIIYTNKNNNGYLYTHNNNESTMSYRNINHNRSISRKDHDIPKNKNRYQSVIKTERNEVKTKKYFNGYEGTKTEVNNEKNGNSKYLNDTKTGKKLKNFYYGPIDIKNIVIGSSLNQIIEKLTEILIKHRVKYWKLNQLKFYCNKNGEIFVIEIFNLSNKIVMNDDKDKKEENEVSEFDIDNSENKDKNKNDNKKNNKSNMIFYVTVLSKDSSNKGQAKNINKIINKKFGEIFKK